MTLWTDTHYTQIAGFSIRSPKAPSYFKESFKRPAGELAEPGPSPNNKIDNPACADASAGK
jgi:hypothetical protein